MKSVGIKTFSSLGANYLKRTGMTVKMIFQLEDGTDLPALMECKTDHGQLKLGINNKEIPLFIRHAMFEQDGNSTRISNSEMSDAARALIESDGEKSLTVFVPLATLDASGISMNSIANAKSHELKLWLDVDAPLLELPGSKPVKKADPVDDQEPLIETAKPKRGRKPRGSNDAGISA